MKQNLKILVFTVPSWNSKVGANSWATLLEGYDSKNVANIYIRDEIPDSKACSNYFNISENKIIKSVFKRWINTGRVVTPEISNDGDDQDLQAHRQRYQKMGKKRRYSMLLAREIIWKFGKWKTKALDDFLDEFKPDVILHSMDGYIHLNRIIEYAIKRTGAKAVGYIWDDNFTYKQHQNLGYRIYRFFQRQSLKRLAKKTSDFFAIAPMAKEEADKFFGIDCILLTKPINSVPVVNYRSFGDCIRVLYTGNLYIGREQTLLKVLNAAKRISNGKFYIDVYTNSNLEADYLKKIDPTVCTIYPPIPQAEVLEKQKDADVLLFLEDVDGPDANVARLSFSTKITDYLSAGKCILAVGNPETAPMKYFADNKAAIVCGSETDIYDALVCLSESPEVIIAYAENAAKVGLKNHSKEDIKHTFDEVIERV